MEYEGHKVTITNGYYDVYYPEHPNARKNGSVMLQILVAEKILGRYLKKEEVVHHKDGNRLNNNIDNLMVFASQADHAFYHKIAKQNFDCDFLLYKKNGVYFCAPPDWFFQNHSIMKIRKNGTKVRGKTCPGCGKPIEIKSALCMECRISQRQNPRKPSRGVLKNEIRKHSFKELERKYGISDNAIRKWCKSYNLPYHTREIKNISNHDWKYL